MAPLRVHFPRFVARGVKSPMTAGGGAVAPPTAAPVVLPLSDATNSYAKPDAEHSLGQATKLVSVARPASPIPSSAYNNDNNNDNNNNSNNNNDNSYY